jgi:3-oxoacyl-[acyl-carrier protein] reductase
MSSERDSEAFWEKAVVVVTGGGQGIGFGIAKRMVERGALVVLAEKNAETGEKAAAELGGLRGKAEFQPCDVSVSSEVDEMVKGVVARHGRLNVVVNNAGIVRANMLWNLTDDQWNKVLQTNLFSMFYMVRAAANAWMLENGGSIVNISSIGGLRGSIGQINYATAKAGVVGLTKAAALELGKNNVRVNAIAPGTTETPMTRTIMETEKLRERFQKEIPLGRFGTPDDVASAAMFLAGPEASWITGKVLVVDGGAYN